MTRSVLVVTPFSQEILSFADAGNGSGAAPEPDVLIVSDSVPEGFSTRIPKARRVLFETEPPDMERYPHRFRQQFGLVITSDRRIRHPNARFSYPGLGVWAAKPMPDGSRCTDAGILMEWEPEKTKLLSVVSSNKKRLPGHRARQAFVARLKQEFGDGVDVFGRGIRDFPFKEDVLADYRFHVVLENSSLDHYWTEKLADPFVTLTYPLYYGCTNISDYFAPECLTAIDIADPDAAIATIRRVIASDIDREARSALKTARRQVLQDYFFDTLARSYTADLPTAPALPRNERILTTDEAAPLLTKADRVWSRFRRWTRKYRGKTSR